jgi:hypothetical protein
MKAMQENMDANQSEMKANREERKAGMKANRKEMRTGHKEMMAKLDAHHERMMACLGKTEATDLEANPEDMESGAEHREVPKEEAAAKSSGALKKCHRGQHLAAGCHRKLRKGPGEIVGAGRNWQPPTEG